MVQCGTDNVRTAGYNTVQCGTDNVRTVGYNTVQFGTDNVRTAGYNTAVCFGTLYYVMVHCNVVQ